MGKFFSKPKYDQIIEGKDKGKFALCGDLTYSNFEGKIIEVKEGFITDGYSKPHLALIIKLFGDNYSDDIRPAVIHDWRCAEKNCTEKYASKEFLQAMLDVGVDKDKAKKMYWGVRLFQMFQKGWQKQFK